MDGSHHRDRNRLFQTLIADITVQPKIEPGRHRGAGRSMGTLPSEASRIAAELNGHLDGHGSVTITTGDTLIAIDRPP
jgi:hypothetical protein